MPDQKDMHWIKIRELDSKTSVSCTFKGSEWQSSKTISTVGKNCFNCINTFGRVGTAPMFSTIWRLISHFLRFTQQ